MKVAELSFIGDNVCAPVPIVYKQCFNFLHAFFGMLRQQQYRFSWDGCGSPLPGKALVGWGLGEQLQLLQSEWARGSLWCALPTAIFYSTTMVNNDATGEYGPKRFGISR